MRDENIFDGVNVSISGIQEEDEFVRSKLKEETGHTIDKLGKMFTIESFVMHVRKYHKTGNRVKYSVQARLITEKGDFFSDDYAWELTKAAKGALEKLESEVIRKSEKEKDEREL
jgi:ribosome-associated translation inhibitor RaiA